MSINTNFPQLAMANFSASFKGQKLTSMHNTNPQPFSQKELEGTIGYSFASLLNDVDLGFAPDEGNLALRQTLSTFHYHGIKADELMTFAGAQEALYCVYNALLHAGDKVLVVAPVYEPLLKIPQNMGCKVSIVELNADKNWSLDLNIIEEYFKAGTRLFVINYPHNPTGATLSHKELSDLVELCRQYDVWLLSDEVFRGLEHAKQDQLPTVADSYEKGISVGVISKGYAIPGIRVGWMACQNDGLCKVVNNVKGYLSVCNSQLDECVASEVLKFPDKLTKRNLSLILPNKECLTQLTHLLGHEIDIVIPCVGCCVFAQLKDDNISAEALAKKIAKQTGYLIFPSNLFCTTQNGFRIGFGQKQFSEFVKACA
jgi:aspartate/methionine/tyrosine aminotransferase